MQNNVKFLVLDDVRRYLSGFRRHKMSLEAKSLSAAFMGYAGLAAQPSYDGNTMTGVEKG